MHRDLDLAAELLQLVDGGRALQVGRDQGGMLARLAQPEGELGGGGRLAGALEAREQDHGGRTSGEGEIGAPGAHEGRELLVHDLDHLLAGREALQDVLADRPRLHRGDEVLDDREVDVRFEQGEAHLAHGPRDGLLVELLATPKVAECRLELVGEGVEHGRDSVEAGGGRIPPAA